MQNTIHLSNLSNVNFFVDNIISHFHYWNNHSSWKTPENGRENNALMFLENCKCNYVFENKTNALALENNVIYIPQGSTYSCNFINNNSGNNKLSTKKTYSNFYCNGENSASQYSGYNAIFIGFSIYDSNHLPIILSDNISIISLKNIKKIQTLFFEMATLCNNGNPVPIKKSIYLYRLLYELSNQIQLSHSNKRKLQLNPAIKYIGKNNFDDINIKRLAEVCQMSESGFREIFKSEFGVSPIDYISDLKIQKADELLRESTLPISSIAHNLGFSDVGYFSKFYKKRTGQSPSKMR